jgi:hypothetical protein
MRRGAYVQLPRRRCEFDERDGSQRQAETSPVKRVTSEDFLTSLVSILRIGPSA